MQRDEKMDRPDETARSATTSAGYDNPRAEDALTRTGDVDDEANVTTVGRYQRGYFVAIVYALASSA